VLGEGANEWNNLTGEKMQCHSVNAFKSIFDFHLRKNRGFCRLLSLFLRIFNMNESALCYRRMSVCLSVCNEMYCDETTNATNIPFCTNIPLDNRNRSAKRCRKNPPFLPPAAILNFCRPTFEKIL
jgi:hypothetical protein